MIDHTLRLSGLPMIETILTARPTSEFVSYFSNISNLIDLFEFKIKFINCEIGQIREANGTCNPCSNGTFLTK